MKILVRLGALFGAMLFSVSVYAGDIKVEGAWARATAPGQSTAMVDLVITSVKDAKLVGFASTVSKSAQIHSMTHDNGMMKMREVQAVELPAGKRVALGEQGYHLMLVDLVSPLKAGERVPLILTVNVAGKDVKLEVAAEVKPLTEVEPMNGHMHDMHNM